MSRRVMLMAYNFPPVAGAGIERTLKHVSYLPEHAWQPVVIAPANPAYRLIDAGSLSRIPPGAEVHRAPVLEPAHIRRLAHHLARGQPSAPRAASSHLAVTQDPVARAADRLRGRLNAAWAWLVPTLFFPDEQLLWAPSALVAGWLSHRRDPVDVVYSSAPPFSTHLAAGLLKDVIGVPWVADFRDPWIGNSFARPLGTPHRRLQADMERWMVSTADRVVFSTNRLTDLYRARYPALAGRFTAIPNGYDLADLASLSSTRVANPRANGGTFLLAFVGASYARRELSLFLDGVERLLARRPELRDRLRVEFIGWFSAENQEIAASRLPRLAPVVRHLGFRPRDEAVARLRAADAALVLIADDQGRELVVGAKVYEYIGLDKPILAVAPPGEARATLEELGWGVLADPTAEGVASGLERIIESPAPIGHADPERRYERRTLTAQLARLLDELAPGATDA